MRCRALGLGCALLTSAVTLNLYAQRSHSVGAVNLPSHSSVTFAPHRPSTPMRPAPAIQNQHQSPHGPGLTERHHGGGVGYQTRTPYLYPNHYVAYPWLFPYGYGLPFSDDTSADDVAPQPPADVGNEAPPPEVAANDAPQYRPPYQPQPVEAPARPQPATTLVFNDGRPAIQVHNYALTSSTLFALDDEKRLEIPLSDLNLPATIDANRKAGVDFALPSSH